MTVITPLTQNEDAYVWTFEQNPLTPFYKRDQMEKAKYLEWITTNVKAQVQLGIIDERIGSDGELNYNLSHLVKIAGQYGDVKAGKSAINTILDFESANGFSEFGKVFSDVTISWKRQHRITITNFSEHIFHRLRNGQNGYLPSLARACDLVLGKAVRIGCRKAENISMENRRRRESLSEDLNATMNLMETNITREIEEETWLRNFKVATDTPAGYVYLVTSPLLNAVKIGHWGGTIDTLRSRYVTSYGANLTLTTTWVKDRKEAEALLHERFSDHCITNELFEKEHIWYYLANWIV